MRYGVLSVVLLLAGCANVAEVSDLRAPQSAAEWQTYNEQAARLDRVNRKIWPVAAALCRTPDPAACFTSHLGTSDRIGAFAGEGRFIVSTGLMKALRSDDEIALIVSHEWSHSLLDHGPHQDIATKELEADCLGAIITTLAGYDTKAALRAHREVMAPLERQQTVERVMLLFVGVISIAEYPSTERRIVHIETAVDKTRQLLNSGLRIARADINLICGTKL